MILFTEVSSRKGSAHISINHSHSATYIFLSTSPIFRIFMNTKITARKSGKQKHFSSSCITKWWRAAHTYTRNYKSLLWDKLDVWNIASSLSGEALYWRPNKIPPQFSFYFSSVRIKSVELQEKLERIQGCGASLLPALIVLRFKNASSEIMENLWLAVEVWYQS